MPPTLSISDMDVKLRREKNRFEREPLNASSDSMRWRARCMHAGCPWLSNEISKEEAIRHAAQGHSDTTGHPVKLRVTVEFDCGIIRAEGAVR